MKFKEYKNETLGESIFCGKHSSGLEIRVIPKKDYKSAYALFAVKYGSVDVWLGDDKGKYKKIPEGTAHFLEHKLFESEEIDAFQLFERTGAYANAYTSFEQTAYLFKGSDNIDVSLGYLLDFVQNPYFTAETVQKEQGIIGQEIMMYKDSPDWVILFNLLGCLYKSNPVKIDIAGTPESIAQIDDKLLHKIYDTYYNPSNMILSIAGNVDPEKIFDQVSKAIIRKKKAVPERKFEKESGKAVSKYVEQKFPVGKKQFYLGYKEELKEPLVKLEDDYATAIYAEALFGSSTDFFKKLVDGGLVDMDLSASLFCGYGYSTFIISATSENPEKAVKAIKDEIKKAQKTGVSKEAFERAKRKIYGRAIMSYNDIEYLSNLQTGLYFEGYKPFAEIDAIKKVTLDRVNKRLDLLKEASCALSVITPLD